MTYLTQFNFHGQGVRTLTGEHGEPWFVAKDACDVLSLGNTAQAIVNLDEDEKGVTTADTPGGRQRISIISEAGLYSLIFRSRKPDAREFKRWVTHEVLPSIRKTGSYATLTGPELMARALIEAQATIEATEAKLAIAAPKAEYVDAFVSPDDLILFRVLANQLGIGEQALREQLMARKWIYKTLIGRRFSKKQGHLVDEYEYRASAGKRAYFRLVPQHKAPRHHNNQLRQTLYVTPQGAVAIRRNFASNVLETV